MTTPVTLTAADMVSILRAEPTAAHASARRQVGSLTVTLSRALNHWMLTVEGDAAPDMATANAWAAAVGAPHSDWWMTRQGQRLTLDWWEGE